MKKINETFFPVFEWTTPKAAIMGGFTLDKETLNCQPEYLAYLEELSKHIPVVYFANNEFQNVIKEEIDTSNIEFVDYQLNSIWMRDYAPIWLKCRETSSFTIANFPYGANHFGKKEKDDKFSEVLSEYLKLPLEIDFPRKQVPFYFDGGNIFVDEEGNCFTAIREDDPPEEFRRKLLININCNNLVVMNAIPNEPTGHVDTFMKVLPEKKVILAKYKNPELDKEMAKNREILLSLGYDITDIEHSDEEGKTNWSYANALIVGNKAFVPQYGLSEDLAALECYREAGFETIAIKASTIMKENGSLHCITNFIY